MTFDPLDPRAAPILVGERLLDEQKHLLIVQAVRHDPSFGGEVLDVLDVSAIGVGRGTVGVNYALDRLYASSWQYAGPPRVLNRRGRRPPIGATYVGRPTKWGNPFSIVEEGSRAGAIARFERWLLEERPDLVQAAKLELRGRDLVCWCAPLACHADVWLKIANAR